MYYMKTSKIRITGAVIQDKHGAQYAQAIVEIKDDPKLVPGEYYAVVKFLTGAKPVKICDHLEIPLRRDGPLPAQVARDYGYSSGGGSGPMVYRQMPLLAPVR